MATVLTDLGKAVISEVIASGTVPPARYIGWGIGTSEASASDANLSSPSAEDRVVAVRDRPTDTSIRWVATITSLSSQNITEAGLFVDEVGGVMMMRDVFLPVAVNPDDSITIKFHYNIV